MKNTNLLLDRKYENYRQVPGSGTGAALMDRNSPQNIFPGQRIPDVGTFKVHVSGGDKIFALFDMKKRINPTFEYTKYGNTSLNRFIVHQTLRLNKAVDQNNFPLFGVISNQLLRRSNTFLLVSLHHCEPHGHRKLPTHVIHRTIRKYKTIRQSPTPTMDFLRVYIPKASGGDRPLGVPTLEGRMYTHNWANIMAIALKYTIPQNQHGFYPGRGTLSAGKSVISHAYDDYIYEFDLRQCFDSVMIVPTLECFQTITQCPPSIYNHLISISKSKAKNLQTVESHLGGPINLHQGIHGGSKTKHESPHKGFPQGGGFSPILTSLALSQSIQKYFPNCDLYADDGLLYGYQGKYIKDSFSQPEFKKFGINLNISKSGGIRYNRNTQKDLKFLGLRYVYKDQTLESATRTVKELSQTPIRLHKKAFSLIKAVSEDLLVRLKGLYELAHSGEKEPRSVELNTEIGLLYKTLSDKHPNLEKVRELLKDSSTLGTRFQSPKEFHHYLSEEEVTTKTVEVEAHHSWGVGRETYSLSKPRRTWDQFIQSKIAGLLQSRLYNNSGDPDSIAQDFTLRFTKNSGIGRGYKSGDYSNLTVFNSSTVACRSLANMLRRQYHYKIKKTPKPGHAA